MKLDVIVQAFLLAAVSLQFTFGQTTGAVPTCDFYAIRPSNNTPLTEARVSEPIQLRLTCEQQASAQTRDLFGHRFHVALIPFPAPATITIHVSTVTTADIIITGEVAGFPINFAASIDRLNAAEITVNAAYLPTSVLTNWLTENKGIRITATGGEVGVRVTLDNGDDKASYVAFPDDVLHTDYRIADYETDGEENTVIIAIEDTTTVTLDLSAFDAAERANAMLNGVPILATQPVTMDEFDILHIVCIDCKNIEITSDKPIGVINGGVLPQAPSFKAGYVLNQVPPKLYLDTDFVQIGKDQSSDKLVYYTTHSVGTQGTLEDNANAGQVVNEELTVAAGTPDPLRVRTSTPMFAFSMAEFGLNYNSFVFLPGVRLWSTRNYFYLKAGGDYTVIIAAYRGDIPAIEMVTSSSTTLISTFIGPGSQTMEVDPLISMPGDRLYDTLLFEIDPAPTADDMYEFRAAQHKRFMVFITESVGSGPSTGGAGILPFGLSLTNIFECTRTIPTVNDGIDNDCDGVIDEELRDDIDNDGDGLIDEDTFDGTTEVMDRRIRVTDLFVSDNPGFNNPITVQLHDDGCSVASGRNNRFAVGPFEYTNELLATDPDLYVMDTPAFRAYRFKNQVNVYFRVMYEWCSGDAASCANSCQAGGSTSTDGSLQQADLMIRVRPGKSKSRIHNSP